jgi:hypothetical protein
MGRLNSQQCTAPTTVGATFMRRMNECASMASPYAFISSTPLLPTRRVALTPGVADWLHGHTGCHQLNRVLTAK